MKIKNMSAFFLMLPLAILSNGAFAAVKSSKDKEVEIIGAYADLDESVLYVVGLGFDSGNSFSVSLGAVGEITNLCSAQLVDTPQVISCDFSTVGMPTEGDYRLGVSTGNGEKKNDSFDLTIGGVGLAGPAGPVGPQGPVGETGPAGPGYDGGDLTVTGNLSVEGGFSNLGDMIKVGETCFVPGYLETTSIVILDSGDGATSSVEAFGLRATPCP